MHAPSAGSPGAIEELSQRFPTVEAYGAAPTPALSRLAGEGVHPPPVARGELEGGRMKNCAPTRNAVNGYDPEKHHRRSIRLKEYDYTQAGAYFVTICARHRECPFGQVAGDEMVLNDAGRMVQDAWEELPHRFPTIRLDEFVVMPNHVHFIVWLNPPEHVGTQCRGAINCAPTTVTPIGQSSTVDRQRPTLGQVVRTFKAVITRRIRQAGGHGFAWQRNYYERVIRNDRELNAIRQYIRDNPARWAEDKENPNRITA